MENNNSSESIYGYPIGVKSDFESIYTAISVYATLEEVKHGKVRLRKRSVQVLTFYTLFGYKSETNKLILDSLKIGIDNLTQINSEITKAGYLIRDTMNFRKKHLNKDLADIKRVFSKERQGTRNAFIIRFDKIHGESVEIK